MSNDGWFTISRKLLDCDLWLAEPFTRGQAWIDLIGLARFRAGHVRIKGLRIDLRKGQLAYSEVGLSVRWRRSRGWVRRLLTELENDQRIAQQKNNVTTLITIINYEAYQSGDTANSTADDTAESTAGGTRKNNGNNGNNGNTPCSPPRGTGRGRAKFKKPTIADVTAYCQERGNTIDPQSFIDHYEANGWVCGKNRTPMRDWKAAIRTWEAKRREDQPAKPRSRVATVGEVHEALANGFSLTSGGQL